MPYDAAALRPKLQGNALPKGEDAPRVKAGGLYFKPQPDLDGAGLTDGPAPPIRPIPAKNGYVTRVGKEFTQDDHAGSLSPGDLIAMAGPRKGNGSIDYEHLMLYVGNGGVSTHSRSRFGEHWRIDPSKFYTFLRLP